MSNSSYNYEKWLEHHANRKTMLQKLERSLVPFELFEAINLQNNREALSGEIMLHGNKYHYDISYDYTCIGHDVYDAELKVLHLENRWHNILMGYNKFKVVMDGKTIKTIYSDHEDYFQRVIDNFENEDYAFLYANRSSYINNLLTRYILLRIIENKRPELQLLASVATDQNENVLALATDCNRQEIYMYAFSKREALELANCHDGISRNLTVVYFFNQDFEHDGNNLVFDSGCTKVISAREFMQSMGLDLIERRLFEKRMLMLIGLLYKEELDWQFHRIQRIATDPLIGQRIIKEQKQEFENEIRKQSKRKNYRTKLSRIKPKLLWFQKIPRTLLEDALNVITDKPVKLKDIFHFLCAANLVNAYVNHCDKNWIYRGKSIVRMFQTKKQIFDGLLKLAEERNPNVTIEMNTMPAILVSIRVEKVDYQFSFRGLTEDSYNKFSNMDISKKGYFKGLYLQPIATALYMYSHMLRWQGV